jgi:hypothetical protein
MTIAADAKVRAGGRAGAVVGLAGELAHAAEPNAMTTAESLQATRAI